MNLLSTKAVFHRVVRKHVSILLLLWFGVSAGVAAVPGDLDTTYVNFGRASLAVGSPTTSDYATSSTLQPDGKLVIAGQCAGVTNVDFCVLRLNTDGSLDSNFNFVGAAITPVGAADDRAAAIAVQADGRIVVAGTCLRSNASDMCAVRYTANGALDTTFNGTGKLILNSFGDSNGASAIALQPDGKILISGYCGVIVTFCLVRLDSSGQLDGSFNTTGRVSLVMGAGSATATSVNLLPDGRLLVGGYCYEGFCVARLNSAGDLDGSFGSQGRAITSMTLNGGRSSSAVLFPDGRLMIVGYCSSSFFYKFCAVRYNNDGSLDTSFGGTGIVRPSMVSGHAVANVSVALPDGKTLLAGSCYNGANDDYCAARLNTDGSLDTTFGTNGWAAVAGTQTEQGNSLSVLPDGKFFIVGYCPGGFCVTRHIGGPYLFRDCKPDVDGDGEFLATTDALIFARIALGILGAAVVEGISFPTMAHRKTWPAIRTYLVTQCGFSLR